MESQRSHRRSTILRAGDFGPLVGGGAPRGRVWYEVSIMGDNIKTIITPDGTSETVEVDPAAQETIKTYTDLKENTITVGHEEFGTPHNEKSTTEIDNAYDPNS
jgi:hypothetical protein